jgi:glycolate oxidase
MENLKATGNPFGESREKRTDVYPSTFQPKKGPVDALLFAGCVTSYQDINIIPNIMKIMDQAGITYTALGKDENCCGYISYLVGTKELKRWLEKIWSPLKTSAQGDCLGRRLTHNRGTIPGRGIFQERL